jgi:hypothetical protein
VTVGFNHSYNQQLYENKSIEKNVCQYDNQQSEDWSRNSFLNEAVAVATVGTWEDQSGDC